MLPVGKMGANNTNSSQSGFIIISRYTAFILPAAFLYY